MIVVWCFVNRAPGSLWHAGQLSVQSITLTPCLSIETCSFVEISFSNFLPTVTTFFYFFLFCFWVIVPKFWLYRCVRQFSYCDYIWVTLNWDSTSFSIYSFSRNIPWIFWLLLWKYIINQDKLYKLKFHFQVHWQLF